MNKGLGSLMVTIGVNTTALVNATRQMQTFGATAQSSAASASKAMTLFGNNVTRVGKSLTTSLSVPLALFGAAATKTFADFEFSMTKIESLVGIGHAQVVAWGEAIKKLGPALGRSPKELAEAMYFITSAGLRGQKAMEVLEMSTKASVVGMGEVKVIADVVTSAMNAYGSEVLTAADATDILTVAVREGKVEADQMAGSIGKVLPIASQMGVPFEEVSAAMAAMTRTGTDAITSAIQLRQILNSLQKPSVEARKSLSDMKLNGVQQSFAGLRKTIRDDGLLQALEDITSLSRKYGETVVSELFPNIRAMTGVFDIMGANVEFNRQIFQKLTNYVGYMERAFGIASETLKVKFNRIVAQSHQMLINFGESIKTALIPLLYDLLERIQKLTKWWTTLTTQQQQSILKWGGILIVAGPVLAILGSLISSFGTLIKVIKGTAVAFRILWTVMATNPFIALAGILAGVVVYLRSAKGGFDDLTQAQKDFNKVIEDSKKLAKSGELIKDLMDDLYSMNLRQAKETMNALETESAAYDDSLLALKSHLKDVQKVRDDAKAKEIAARTKLLETPLEPSTFFTDNPNTGGNKLLSIIKKFYSDVTETKRWSAEEDLIVNNSMYQRELQAQIDHQSKLLAENDKYRTQVAAQIKKLEELQESRKQEAGYIDPDVNEVNEKLMRQLDIIADKVKRGKGEYDGLNDTIQAYSGSLDDMYQLFAVGNKQSVKYISQWTTKLQELQTATDPSSDALKKLGADMDLIAKQSRLFGDSFDAVTPKIQVLKETLLKLDEKKDASVIQILTDDLRRYEAMLPQALTLQQQLNQALEEAALFEGRWGTAISHTSAQLQIQQQYLWALIQSGKASTQEINKQIEVVDRLTRAMQEQQLQADIAQAMQQSLVQFATSIGQAFASTESVGEAMVDNLISMLSTLAGSLISVAMAALFMKGAISGGLAGVLIMGGIGASILLGLWSANRAKAKEATKMASGGIVPSGYPNDTFPAMLSSNEAVIPLDRLYKLIPQADNGGTVEFVIDGTVLKGVLDRQTTKNNSY